MLEDMGLFHLPRYLYLGRAGLGGFFGLLVYSCVGFVSVQHIVLSFL